MNQPDEPAIFQALVDASMKALDSVGACDRSRTFRVRILGPVQWALDFYPPNHPERRTLLMEITDTGEPE